MDDYKAVLDALHQARQAEQHKWNARFEAWEEENRQAREENNVARREEIAAIDAQINALYLQITNGRGLLKGDVVVALQKYGDLKTGEHGFFEKEWLETERTHELWVTLEVDGGSISVPKACVALELNADTADKFRLAAALRHLQWTEGKRLIPLLKEAQGIVAAWVLRLEGDAS